VEDKQFDEPAHGQLKPSLLLDIDARRFTVAKRGSQNSAGGDITIAT